MTRLNMRRRRYGQTSYANDPSLGSDYQESWFKTVYKWLVTIDGDSKLNEERGYRSLPYVTNYVFFLGGRLHTLRHKDHIWLLVLAIIVVPMVLFSVFEANKLWHTKLGYKALVFLFYYFWAMSCSFFIRTATSDAGVLPKNVHLAQLNNRFQIPQEYHNCVSLPTPSTARDPLSKVEVKYCTACRIWRPPRASHCSTCGVCIMTHDHHCFWVNNCIGQRNYRYFIAFLVSAVATALFLIANCSVHIARSQPRRPSRVPVTILLLTYACLVIWYPAILLGYHIFMTGTQQTTREFLRHVHSKNPVFTVIRPAEHNPYDTGSFLRNMAHLMLQPRGPSAFSARERHRRGDWRFVTVPGTHSFEKLHSSQA
ncbi:hypothetical protein HG536_0C00660 [Torulaspora globosa]|uniref:Palmitoyltransferase n=1 Tax=Torulaspora globosa TaxID=48254 RepID=A0A7G3ZEG3_9SACH|nr:uncharacterized protein HG536_0C00660 [Torulaspora globosa]QLL31899.1 hypothetical protein HG536_0C00660 [Torulaspora globosa]